MPSPTLWSPAAGGAPLRIRKRTAWIAVPVTLVSLSLLLTLDHASFLVAAPVLAIINIAVWFLVALWNRDGVLPVFEVGTICVAVTTLYSSYPLFAFLMADGSWTTLSDNRLQQWNPDFEALGRFAWRHVVYLGTFALVYQMVRGRASGALVPVKPLARHDTVVVVWLFFVLTTYFAAIWVLSGISYRPSYEDVRLGLVGVPRDLPYALQQISHNLYGMVPILKLCGIALLIQHWRYPASRLVLAVWLLGEIVLTAVRMGARSEAVILLLATALLYHRLVRPLSLRTVITAAATLVALVLLYGFGRDFANASAAIRNASYWSAANEFQILLGTAYDLHMQQATGELETVPWQVYASDLLMLIPSQLLPFAKIDPAEWYVGLLNLQGQQGLMFGVIAQAVIGYDWLELLVRGAVLGALFAFAHRMYARRAASFWATLLYLYLCLWSYYTFRASTFYFVYVILYRFLPTVIVVRAAAGLVRWAALAARPAPALLPDSRGPSCAGS